MAKKKGRDDCDHDMIEWLWCEQAGKFSQNAAMTHYFSSCEGPTGPRHDAGTVVMRVSRRRRFNPDKGGVVRAVRQSSRLP